MAKAIVKTTAGAGGVTVRDVRTPPPGKGEAQVEVSKAGICGTDLHILDGEWPTNPPVVMGHEFSGTIVAVGEGVPETWHGVGVVSEVLITDGTCEFCLQGKRNVCPNRRALGRLADGAFTTHVNVPLVNLHRVPAGLGLTDAALAEPLACVLGGIMDPPVVAAGDRVLVTGPGAIGILAAQVARAAGGIVTVVGTPRDQARIDVARQLGFEVLGEDGLVDPELLREQFGVVIECSGAAAAANLCLSACAIGGTHVQLGIFGRAVAIDLDQLCLKGATYITSYAASPAALDRALVLLSNGAVQAAPVITRIASLNEWESVFRESREGLGLKYLFDPSL